MLQNARRAIQAKLAKKRSQGRWGVTIRAGHEKPLLRLETVYCTIQLIQLGTELCFLAAKISVTHDTPQTTRCIFSGVHSVTHSGEMTNRNMCKEDVREPYRLTMGANNGGIPRPSNMGLWVYASSAPRRSCLRDLNISDDKVRLIMRDGYLAYRK